MVGVGGPASGPGTGAVEVRSARPIIGATNDWTLALARVLAQGRIEVRGVDRRSLAREGSRFAMVLRPDDGTDARVDGTGVRSFPVLQGAPLLLGSDGEPLEQQRVPPRRRRLASAGPEASILPGVLASFDNARYATARTAFSIVEPAGRLARTRLAEGINAGLVARQRLLARCPRKQVDGPSSTGAELYLGASLSRPLAAGSRLRRPQRLELSPAAAERQATAVSALGRCALLPGPRDR